MLNIFPNILFLGILAPTLLRLLVGGIFIEFGYSKLTKDKNHKIETFEKSGLKPGKFFVWFFGLLEIIIGLGLVFGIYTQCLALIGALVMLGAIYLKKQNPEGCVNTKMYFFILFVILISLILTGAGALAFDIGL